MNRAVFVAGLRTPFARAGKGAYRDVRPDDLLVELFRAHRQRHPAFWRTTPDDAIVGCAYPEGEQGYNIARTAALGAGLPLTGVTVNRLCASSLEAAAIAAARIRGGWGDAYLVAGVESMSRIPRRGGNFSESDLIKSTAPRAYMPNGETAEEVARRYPRVGPRTTGGFRRPQSRTRRRGLRWRRLTAARSTRSASIATSSSASPSIAPRMQSLPPAFRDDGVVTAATSSPLTDGATCGWVVEKCAIEAGVDWGLEILDASWGHVAPEVMGIGPVPATRKILERNGVASSELAAVELNEAFAVQVLASLDELAIPLERVNTWGGRSPSAIP